MKVSIEDLLSNLDGVRRLREGSWAAKCPAHDDRHGSLVVSVGDIRPVCFCHAGCDEPSVLNMVGIDKRDLFYDANHVETPDGRVNISQVTATPPTMTASTSQPRPQTTAAPSVEMPPEHVLNVLAERLRPLYARLQQLKGWGATTIEQCRLGWESDDPTHPEARIVIPNYGPDGRMIGYVRYKPGAEPKMLAVGPRELYPAPETLPAGDGTVWLVEGEPDRVSAVEIGLNATGVPGVGTWKAGWAKRFRGRRVIVCMDCDAVGREAATERLRQLRDANVDAVVVDLDPRVNDGTDLGDMLTAASQTRRVDALRRYLIELEGRAWEAQAA